MKSNKIKNVMQRIGNTYKVKKKRELLRYDVVKYFKGIINKEQPYCERCGSTHPYKRLLDFNLCKFCYYTKLNMESEENTPDIEDIARFNINKKELFSLN